MNSFGTIFKITTWGESHGPAMGVVIEGCPAGLTLNTDELTTYLQAYDRPIPGLATERVEPNNAEILSGVHNGITLGTPLSIMIKNENVHTYDYKKLDSVFRPGHGDYTYFIKHNVPNPTGGGRSSGRECITRLAAGYVAEKVIKHFINHFSIKAYVKALAGIRIIDNETRTQAIKKAAQIASKGDSTGGLVKIRIRGLPPGIGEPVFGGIDAKLAAAFMSIGAVKSVEIGKGTKSSVARGSEFNDDFCKKGFKVRFKTNNNGGVLSGITTGEELTAMISVKPTPSIRLPKTGLNTKGKLKEVVVTGRHDKNITPRIAPIARAMASLCILDHLMITGKISKDTINSTTN